MVHILPHWTWPGLEGKIIPVVAYANCDAVELFLDGESLGVKEMGEAMRLQWNVVYRPGILKAVGIAGGKPVAECRHETAGEAAAIKLSADKETIRADGTGIAHVTVTIVDAQGRFVPRANPELTFAVAGAGALIGLENGDPIDTTNYKLNSRKAFNGMALAVVQAAKVPGPVSVTVTAEGLASATIRLVVATSGS
jgi:beta-galactosidase